MSTDELDRLLTRNEVADLLHVHPVTVSTMVREGRLRAVKIGRALRIPAGVVAAFIAGIDEPPAIPSDHWPPTSPLW